MFTRRLALFYASIVGLRCLCPTMSRADDSSLPPAEIESLFDGKTLDQWQGDMRWWSVEDGAIVGSNRGRPLPCNTCLVWKGADVENFRLEFQATMEVPNNVGAVLYRAYVLDDQEWRCGGYRLPIEVGAGYIGMLWGEATGRGRIAARGEKVIVDAATGLPQIVDSVCEITPINAAKWHKYRIEARGNHLQHFIDDQLVIDATDNHKKAHHTGKIALQLHVRADMTMRFKDLQLTRYPNDEK